MKMKKIFLSLVLVISFFFLSGFTTLAESENRVIAQDEDVEPPIYLSVVNYSRYEFLQENANTYEYLVTFYAPFTVPETIGQNDYYLITKINENFRKGIHRGTNSYEFENKRFQNDMTYLEFRVTVLKSLIDSNYPTNIAPLFYRDIMMYVNATLYVYDDFYNDTYNRAYNKGYEDGYNDGYNDINVADYFGTNNIAKDPDIHYSAYSDPLEPTISKVIFNKGYNYPNTLLDKPYLIVRIKKNIYDDIVVVFDDYTRYYHYEAIHHDIGDYDIYVFDFSNRINSKYRIEIIKENVTTGEEAMKFLDDVVENLYFSHASKLLTSEIALEFYYFGYIEGLDENITDNDAYEIGFDVGYDRGYNDGQKDGYDQGFEDGYEDGFNDGKTAEYDKGYKDGYKQGSHNTFLNDVSKWFGPMVLIVLIAGAYVSLRNRRSGD